MSRKEENIRLVCDQLKSLEITKYAIDDNCITYSVNIPCQLQHCQVKIIVHEQSITFYSISPINASNETKSAVAEFITRANYGLKSGNFEMDYSDGEVRYKTHLSCRVNPPEAEDIKFHVSLAVVFLHRYGNGLLKNMLGFGNPEKDIEEIEG